MSSDQTVSLSNRTRRWLRRVQRRLDPVRWTSERRLRSMRGMFAGQRCFVMGNGPSLNETPLELLKGEYVWGLNRCYLLFDRIAWRPAFYTAVDTRVVPDIAPEIQNVVRQLPETQFFFPDHYYKEQVLRPARNVTWFRQRRMEPEKGGAGYFSLDATAFLREPNTVAITALQLAVHMGFDPIYLIGCDTSYQIPDDVETEGVGKDPGTGEVIDGYNITSTRDNDPNHFDPGYFGKGAKWHAPNVGGMIYGYERTKKVCDAAGVQIYNATVGGELEVFTRVPFASLFDAPRPA